MSPDTVRFQGRPLWTKPLEVGQGPITLVLTLVWQYDFPIFIVSFVVAHMCVPSNGETEAGEQGQPGLHRKILSLKTNGKKLSTFKLLSEDHLACPPAHLPAYLPAWSVYFLMFCRGHMLPISALIWCFARTP